jgi:4-aminobutyrate aminotransferase
MSWSMGAHGSTFGGNPVSCAAALATIDLLEGELVANSERMGHMLIDGLRETAARQPLVQEVRGLGLMVGVQFESAEVADAVEIACFRHGLLGLRAGDAAIRMAPPLVVNAEQVGSAVRIFEAGCAAVASAGTEAFGPIMGAQEAGPDTPEGT